MMMTEDEIQLVTRGNTQAADFLRVFVAHCHLLDDLVDGDKHWDDERLIASETEWLLTLTGNVFFLQHRALLVPLIIQGFNAWLDSNDWATSTDAYKRIAADVLKGFYHEVVWQVAFLCGGWQHLRAVTTRAREYDFEPPSAPFTTSGKELLDRMQSYLGNGGLFNPEMMEHDKVRELIMDCREYITSTHPHIQKGAV